MTQNTRQFNRNPQVNSILSWHSHDTGGVAVPFKNRPGFGDSMNITTPLVTRLNTLAKQVVEQPGQTAAVFLVGGPGNGKSHATEQFLRTLDSESGCDGKLVSFLQSKFTGSETPEWKIEVNASDLPECEGFANTIGKLWLVQDASAADQPDSNVAENMSSLLSDLIEDAMINEALLFCCANRGVLSDAARYEGDSVNSADLRKIIDSIQDNTEIARVRDQGHALQCWPLPDEATQMIKSVYAWPMDLESICETPDGGYVDSPVDQLLKSISDPNKWDNDGPCTDCSAAAYCPFLQNAKGLRKERTRGSVVGFLRHAELLSGQRWNFRTIYSLIAEMAIGHRQDFGGEASPCDWVRTHVESSELNEDGSRNFPSTSSWQLLRRRFEHSLFDPMIDLADFIGNVGQRFHNSIATYNVHDEIKPRESDSQLRRFMSRVIKPKLDPAVLGSREGLDHLGDLEDAYSHGVAHGNTQWRMDELEKEVFRSLEVDEQELEQEGSAETGWPERLALRRLSGRLAKRSRAFEVAAPVPSVLVNYKNALRDRRQLARLNTPLLKLVGDSDINGGENFNVMSVFGQPSGTLGGGIGLQLRQAGMLPPEPAPNDDSVGPRHDYPMLRLDSGSEVLTFDLYEALIALSAGQSVATLSTGIRATAARLASYSAARAMRTPSEFLRGNLVSIDSGRWTLTLTDEQGQLEVTQWD